MKEQDETSNVKYPEGTTRDLFNIEYGLERIQPRFRVLLRELLDRIIEKRIEYYIPIEDEEDAADGDIRSFSHD